MENIRGQSGYKCPSCPLVLCLDCSNKILNGNKKKECHIHKLALEYCNSFKCDLCKKKYKKRASFYCK